MTSTRRGVRKIHLKLQIQGLLKREIGLKLWMVGRGVQYYADVINVSNLTIRTFILGHLQQKLMTQLYANVQKTYFWALWGPFWVLFQKMRFFQKNCAPSRTIPHGPLTSCTLSEKTNESIPRKLNHKSKNHIFSLFWTLFDHFLAK